MFIGLEASNPQLFIPMGKQRRALSVTAVCSYIFELNYCEILRKLLNNTTLCQKVFNEGCVERFCSRAYSFL